jgi:anti-sigma B factor antagonist
MTALGIDPVITENGTVLRLSGELDLGTIAEAEEALSRIENESRGGLTLDLRYLAFIDSTGLRFILSAHARAVEQDRPFAIVRGPDVVHRVFMLTRLDERLPFSDAADSLPGASEPP